MYIVYVFVFRMRVCLMLCFISRSFARTHMHSIRTIELLLSHTHNFSVKRLQFNAQVKKSLAENEEHHQ